MLYWKGSVLPLPRNDNHGTDVSALEHEIDTRVYQLYGLMEEEIKIVEEGGRE